MIVEPSSASHFLQIRKTGIKEGMRCRWELSDAQWHLPRFSPNVSYMLCLPTPMTGINSSVDVAAKPCHEKSSYCLPKCFLLIEFLRLSHAPFPFLCPLSDHAPYPRSGVRLARVRN